VEDYVTDHQRRVRTFGIGLVLLLSNCLVVAQDKKALETQYKKKFVVVLKEGLRVAHQRITAEAIGMAALVGR
jgi:hypothetical protein